MKKSLKQEMKQDVKKEVVEEFTGIQKNKARLLFSILLILIILITYLRYKQ